MRRAQQLAVGLESQDELARLELDGSRAVKPGADVGFRGERWVDDDGVDAEPFQELDRIRLGKVKEPPAQVALNRWVVAREACRVRFQWKVERYIGRAWSRSMK